MRKIALAVFAADIALVLVLGLGCGSSGNSSKDAGRKEGRIQLDKGPPGLEGISIPERGIPDGGKKDKKPGEQTVGACDAAIVGKPCTDKTEKADCGPTGKCITTRPDGSTGFCTCTCIPDDTATPLVNEDSCPDLKTQSCGRVTYTNGTRENLCMKLCSPKLGSNDCGAPIACLPSAGLRFGFFQQTVCAFPGCTKDSDCFVSTKTTCTGCGADGSKCDPPAQLTCAAGQLCLSDIGGDAGHCVLPGKCDTASGLCADHALGKATAKIGDPCKDDTECAGNMECFMEEDRTKLKKGGEACTADGECCSFSCASTGKCNDGLCVVYNRNGYCVGRPGCRFAKSLTSAACPAGSDCSLGSGGPLYPGGRCFKTCDMTKPADCRNNAADLLGDYECRNLPAIGFQTGGTFVQLSTVPVCEPGTSFLCTDLQSAKMDCTSICATLDTKNGGCLSNTTNMKCRSYDNKVLSNVFDPKGLCLDDTPSGTALRNPLP